MCVEMREKWKWKSFFFFYFISSFEFRFCALNGFFPAHTKTPLIEFCTYFMYKTFIFICSYIYLISFIWIWIIYSNFCGRTKLFVFISMNAKSVCVVFVSQCECTIDLINNYFRKLQIFTNAIACMSECVCTVRITFYAVSYFISLIPILCFDLFSLITEDLLFT